MPAIKKYGRSVHKTWREVATPIIGKVIQDNFWKDEKEIRRALRVAYPFGERRRYPYKVWLNEIKQQLYMWRRWRGIGQTSDLSQLPLFRDGEFLEKQGEI